RGARARITVAGSHQQADARPHAGAERRCRRRAPRPRRCASAPVPRSVKPTLRTKLDSLVRRLEDLNGLLAAEGGTRDLEQFRKLSREHSELAGIVALYERFRQAERDAEAAREMAAETAMKSFADDELKAARGSMEKLEADLQKALLPRDPNDERNIFLEIRAGTGGDESALFAADLFRMYTRYAERQGWQAEIIPPSCASIPSAPRAPAASTSTRPSPRSASPTCRPGSWSSARTRARSTRTARRRSACSRRASATSSCASSRPRLPRRASS